MQRLGIKRNGNKRFVIAGYSLIRRQTLVGLMRPGRVVEGFELAQQPVEMAVANRDSVRQKLFLQRAVESLNRAVLPGAFRAANKTYR